MVRDIKLTRNGAFDNTEPKSWFLDFNNMRWCQDTTKSSHRHWLDNKQISKYLFSIHFSMLPSIHHITHEPMKSVILCFCHIVYTDSPMKNIYPRPAPSRGCLGRSASFWGRGMGLWERAGHTHAWESAFKPEDEGTWLPVQAGLPFQ